LKAVAAATRRLRGVLAIIRPINVLISMVAVVLAVLICNPTTAWVRLLFAGLVAGLVASGANAINDYFDIEIDRINRPDRPLPAGLLSPRQACVLCGCFFVLAWFPAAFIGIPILLVVLFSELLLYWYSAFLKQTAVWGNLTVSFCTGLAFLFGGLTAGNIRPAVLPAIFAFLINWAREIVKDIEDVPGDRQQHARTLPILYGERMARSMIAVLLALLIAVTILAHLLGFYGYGYFAVVMVLVNPLLFWVLIKLWPMPDAAGLHRMSQLLKTAMVLGLIAIVLGSC
jgi:geranylgeranylglycerol-phosphate geranylgeranyltransferase